MKETQLQERVVTGQGKEKIRRKDERKKEKCEEERERQGEKEKNLENERIRRLKKLPC